MFKKALKKCSPQIPLSTSLSMHDLRYALLRNTVQFGNVSNWITSFISGTDILIAPIFRWDEIRAWMNRLRLTNIE